MASITLTLTSGEATLIAVVCFTVAFALIASFVVAYINHRYTLAQGKKLATKWLHVILVGVSSLFTGLQYYTPWLQTHLRTLETLPYIGAYAVGIYAAANFLYAVKAKSWFQSILKTAEKLDTTASALPGLTPEATPVPAQAVEDVSNFAVQ